MDSGDTRFSVVWLGEFWGYKFQCCMVRGIQGMHVSVLYGWGFRGYMFQCCVVRGILGIQVSVLYG